MLPLAGQIVLEAPRLDSPRVHRLALALAGKMSADLGARVTKLVPAEGDPLHRVPVLPWEKDREPLALRRFLDTAKSFHASTSEAGKGDNSDLIAEANILLTDDPAEGVEWISSHVANS